MWNKYKHRKNIRLDYGDLTFIIICVIEDLLI